MKAKDRNKNLFHLNEIKSATNSGLDSALLSSDQEPNTLTFSGRASSFLKFLQEALLIESQYIDFMTAGNLSLHNIIELILKMYGPCKELYISTWAIKEAAARSLLSLKEQNLIGSMHGIFDYRIKTVDSKSFQLIEQHFFRYELTKNHAKVILIEYGKRCFTIVCSANLSNNPRIEAGFISLSTKTFIFHKEWMLKVFEGKKIY